METEAVLDRANTIFGRAELVQKSAEDLFLDAPPFSLPPDRTLNVGAVSLGYIRELFRLPGATIGLGAVGTLNTVPAVARAAYGSRTPLGGLLFLRLRSTIAKESRGGMQHMHDGTR